MNILEVARGELGYSRWLDSQEGTKYGRWYAEQVKKPYYASSGVPFCAMFVSWCAAQAGISMPGGVFAYCPTGEANLRNAGLEVSFEEAREGDIVFFDWHSDGVADHVGIVESRGEGYLVTIEGNTSEASGGSQTNGGCVARKRRARRIVKSIMELKVSSHQDNNSEGEASMIFAFQPNDEGRIIFYDGQAHELRHEDELEVVKNLYREINGRDLPIIKLGSEAEPWASRFLDLISRGATNYTPLIK